MSEFASNQVCASDGVLCIHPTHHWVTRASRGIETRLRLAYFVSLADKSSRSPMELSGFFL